mmetsp:Transcript_3060/g.8309  ORF Transcript_3060/g.8309 Transcript_3060/m.8309 type:complete len:218 (-) Transcript_3060:192-845(-)
MMHGTAAARLLTAVARCTLTTRITKSAVGPRRNLFGESVRASVRPAPVSSAISKNFSSWSVVGGSGTGIRSILVGDTRPAIHAQQAQAQATKNDAHDEQRRYRSNRSRRGLYDGKDIRTGNNLSFSMKHTKRTFKPNVFIKRVYSEILDEMVRFHLTTSTLRSIDKCGGLDNYLLTSRHVKSGEGLKTKKRIVNALKYRERKARQQQTTSKVESEKV